MSLHNMHVARMLITTVTRGEGAFLILQDVMGWATGFFIPCLGEGQQKTVSTETDFAAPSPVLYDQSLSVVSSGSFFHGLGSCLTHLRNVFNHLILKTSKSLHEL